MTKTELLQELLDVVNEPTFGHDHTGAVNWLLDFAPKVEAVLQAEDEELCKAVEAEREACAEIARVVANDPALRGDPHAMHLIREKILARGAR